MIARLCGQEARGATHVAELSYAFNQHVQRPEWSDTDWELADIMSSYWVFISPSRGYS